MSKKIKKMLTSIRKNVEGGVAILYGFKNI